MVPSLRLAVRPELRQQDGFVHGGVIAYLVDNAITFAAGRRAGREVLTGGFTVDDLRPGSGGSMRARAFVVRAGSRTAVAQCDVQATDEAGDAARTGDAHHLLTRVGAERALEVGCHISRARRVHPGVLENLLLAATWVCLAANAAIVIAKVAKAEFVLANVRDVGLSPGIVPLLAVLEGAGVVGVALGLWRYPGVGLAAALGLAGFFIVAVAAHVRSRRTSTIGFPATFLLLAALAAVHFAR